MNHTMFKGKIAILFSILLLVTGSFFTRQAQAEEITITGNGADSDSEVTVSNSTNTNISSDNTANIDNSVNVNSNTGNNSASGNTGGDTQVQTGNTTTNTDIQNTGNTNVVNVNTCCNTGTSSINITNNGSGSVNTVNHQNISTTNVSANNYASIYNNVTVNANTGGNIANYNNGDVYVRTGDISVNTILRNGPINANYINLGLGNNGNINALIKGNGSDSLNLINLFDENTTDVQVDNIANIFNNALFNLDTGNNEANDNNGDVAVVTGDIEAQVAIVNEVNTNKVTIDCDCKEKAPEKPTPAAPVEKVTPQGPSQTTSSGHGPGEVAGIAMGKVLPVTGTNWLFLAFIGNVMMLFLGMILRLRSGNSPGAVAVA
jgi:hypothetical protein